MLDAETKRHIDAARQVLVGIVPDPKGQVDQITNALIYKFMDDMDQQSVKAGGEPSFFIGDIKKYSWRALMDTKLGGQDRLNMYVEAIAKFGDAPKFPPLFRDIFKRAFLPYRDPEVLSLFLKEITFFDYANSEKLGDAYEYLLSIMGSQGDAGQFRTPRHIIDFIVKVVNPGKDDTILDPACGTAGFLISAYKHILSNHDEKDNATEKATSKEKRMTPDELKKLPEHFTGYDISPDMVRMSQVNMYLHKFKKPRILEYNTLASDDHWNEKFDVILANPPFMSPKGGVQPHTKFGVQSNRAEVLFVDYIMSHLKPRGRAGMIVPEGIIFQSGTAYKELRKNLVEDGLFAVVSLPSGVFNPYSGVKTSILFFDNEVAKKSDSIFFVKIGNDGFDLGAQRRDKVGSDIPEAIEVLQNFREYSLGKVKKVAESTIAQPVKKSEISKSSDYNLSGDRYIAAIDYSNAKWPIVELGDVCEITAGQSPEGKYYNDKGDGMPFYQGKTEFTEKFLGKPRHWTTQVTKVAEKYDIVMSVRAPVGPINITPQKICIGRGLASIRPVKADPDFVYFLLRSMQDSIKGNSGSTFDSINKADIAKIRIPLPPLEIQKQFVAELDGYQKIIDGARQIVENWKPVIEVDPTWEKVKLGDLLEKVSDQIDPQKKSGEVYYIGLENIESNSGRIVGESLTKYEEIKSFKNTFISGDLLYGKLRPNLNKVWLAGRSGICSTDILVLRGKANVNTNFYWYLLLDNRFVREIMTGIKGSQLPRVGFEFVQNIILPHPSMVIQSQIVKDIEKERSIIESSKSLILLNEEKIKKRIEGVWGK